MNTQSNSYTFIYSVVMVVIVAALLSVISLSLKPFQDANIKNEKRQNILSAANIDVLPAEAEENYTKYITESFVVNAQNQKIDGVEAFNVDIAKEYKKPAAERQLPIFVAEIDGAKKYILPMYGAGLWGAIWGYISFNEDKNTVYGIFFDHAGETPGLGAEITNKEKFKKFFADKKAFNANGERILKVSKGASSKGLSATEVDAISGGTITSNAVDAMLADYFESYKAFLSNNQN